MSDEWQTNGVRYRQNGEGWIIELAGGGGIVRAISPGHSGLDDYRVEVPPHKGLWLPTEAQALFIATTISSVQLKLYGNIGPRPRVGMFLGEILGNLADETEIHNCIEWVDYLHHANAIVKQHTEVGRDG